MTQYLCVTSHYTNRLSLLPLTRPRSFWAYLKKLGALTTVFLNFFWFVPLYAAAFRSMKSLLTERTSCLNTWLYAASKDSSKATEQLKPGNSKTTQSSVIIFQETRLEKGKQRTLTMKWTFLKFWFYYYFNDGTRRQNFKREQNISNNLFFVFKLQWKLHLRNFSWQKLSLPWNIYK